MPVPLYNSEEFSRKHCDMESSPIDKVLEYLMGVTLGEGDIIDALTRMARCDDNADTWGVVLNTLKGECSELFVTKYLIGDIDNFTHFYKDLVSMSKITMLEYIISNDMLVSGSISYGIHNH